MPQGRNKAFSGKQKKLQMMEKRHRKADQAARDPKVEVVEPSEVGLPNGVSAIVTAASGDRRTLLTDDVKMAGGAPSTKRGDGRDKFDLRFRKETKEQLAKMRLEARKEIVPIVGAQMEIDCNNYFPAGLTFPKRPPWSKAMTRLRLDAGESEAFVEFVTAVFRDHEDVSTFELNLETWRQLWRVIEMSDVLLMVVDCRYPAAMLPPSLYEHLRSLGKDMLVVLNKVDLVPLALALAWKQSLLEEYPDLSVTFFTSCPAYNLRGAFARAEDPGLKNRRLRGTIRMVTEGAQQVFDACKDIVTRAGADVDMEPWQELIRQKDRHAEEGPNEEEEEKSVEMSEEESSKYLQEPSLRFRDKCLTVGMLGQPNAGKSSLINSLMGRRVVSVSKTPGHTKHFQTIFVTKSVRLCDCPGLVFPSLVPKPMQVVMGSYPISQLREMFSVLQFVAVRVDLRQLLKLTHPEAADSNDPDLLKWSAYDVAEAWAIKRGYFSARSVFLGFV
jgi:ribosome biogenesis GTPase A